MCCRRKAAKPSTFCPHDLGLSFHRDSVSKQDREEHNNALPATTLISWYRHNLDVCCYTAMGPSTPESPASGHFETGSLTQRAPQRSEFIGSSSGVHFIRLVREGFADTADIDIRNEDRVPRAEDTVGGDDEEDINGISRDDALRSPASQRQGPILQDPMTLLLDYSTLPALADAQAITIRYFQSWHPLIPFLYGPTFMGDLDKIYLDTRQTNERAVGLLLLRSLITTVAPDKLSISPSVTLAIAGQFASHNDILTLQAILMAQLRSVSTMALRMASSLSGLLSRLLLHAGLHRCPHRYEQLDGASRELRKRIFWSAYILDRYISQALGLPPTIADSDIDVCAPGCAELHDIRNPAGSNSAAQSRVCPSGTVADVALDISRANPRPSLAPDIDSDELSLSPDRQEFLLAHMVTHGKLVSRVLEVFHKSIHVRSVESDQVLSLRADANKWFNSLPQWPPRPGLPVLDQLDRPIKAEQTKFVPFLHILYQQLLIAIHRPYLSLPKTSAEFENSLQLVIRAARQTNTLLLDVDEFFWPGYLSSAWMSGLIFTFACQAEAFSIKQSIRYALV